MNRIQDAFYREQIIDEYKGNPFIEALPPILSKEEVMDSLATYPTYDNEDRQLDSQIRIQLISNRIPRIFQPLMRHLDLESKISSIIRQGYISRNPISKEYTESQIRGYKDINKIYYNNQVSNTASSMSIIGMPGGGKTTSIDRILSNFPQVINHTMYNGEPFIMKEVVYLKIDCSFDGGLKSIIFNFFSAVDRLLDTQYFNKYCNGKKNIDTLLNITAQIARNIGLGIFVFDEVQHLELGGEKSLNFLTTLNNVSQIPILYVGTMASKGILQSDLRIARRNISTCGGNVLWDRLENDEEWELLIVTLWRYQYTRKEARLTKQLSDLIYYESQGIIDIAIKIYCASQIEAISTGKEEITVDIVRNVVDKKLTAIKPIVKALKSGNLREIANYKDICTQDYKKVLKHNKDEIDLKERISQYREAKNKMKLNKKQEALIKLLELDINRKKAEVALDIVLTRENDIPLNKLIIEAIKIVETIKLSTKKEMLLQEDDIRKIALNSKDVNEFYSNLKEKSYVVENMELLEEA